MTVSAHRRGRIDVVRRQAIAVLGGIGFPAAAAAALVDHLLWFDQAGRPDQGLCQLGAWVDEIHAGTVRPGVEPRMVRENAATVTIDAAGVAGPLALHQAADIAMQKARDVGVGLVRVTNLGLVGPMSPIVARVAIGPYVGLALAQSAWSCALPTGGGLPVVGDSHLCAGSAVPNLGPLASLVGQGECLIQALAVPTLESLNVLQERLAAGGTADGWLNPEQWEASRTQAIEQGIDLEQATWALLD